LWCGRTQQQISKLHKAPPVVCNVTKRYKISSILTFFDIKFIYPIDCNMKKNIIFTLLILQVFCSTIYSQVSNDSLMKVIEEFKIKKSQNEFVSAKIQYISTNSTKVQILKSCPSNPESCGVMVFASTTMAKIINGKYSGDTVLIAETCSRTAYEINKVYTLCMSSPPFFDVVLCWGQMYNPDWNYNLGKNKYLIFFCRLLKYSSF
jgi:hypothetical protein